MNRDVKKQGRFHQRLVTESLKEVKVAMLLVAQERGSGLTVRELGHFCVTSASYLTAAENKEKAFSTVIPRLMMC